MYTGLKKLLPHAFVVLSGIAWATETGAYVVTGPQTQTQTEIPNQARPLTLADVFDGTARFQTIEESEEVTLDMDVGGQGRQRIWDQKLPVIRNPDTGEYYAFTRAYVPATRRFKLVALTSADGKDFRQKGVLFKRLFRNRDDLWTLYDAHISFDGDEYLMTMECANREYGPSLCLSRTRTPFDLSSWSLPKPIVKNSPDVSHSASTGVSVEFGGDTYVSWTVVDDSNTPYARMRGDTKVISDEDGDESTFSKAVKLHRTVDGDFLFAGLSATVGRTIIEAEGNPYCEGSWDCNNVDIQDWEVEGGRVYAIYNGSNYYRCTRPATDRNRSNVWGIGIRRSDHPLGDYSESTGMLIRSVSDDICGISYPVLNRVGGQTYLYYAYYGYDRNGARINRTMRSRLVPAFSDTLTSRRISRRLDAPSFGTERDILTDRIQALYVKFLNRYPRNDEVAPHLERALREGYVSAVRAVVLSDEHRRVWASRDTSRKIASLYQGILDRQPDPAGARTYEAIIANEDRPLDTLFRLFVDSAEFKSANP